MKRYFWVAIPIIILIGCFYLYKNNAVKFSDKETVKSVSVGDILTVRDIPMVTYPVYINDNGKYGSIHNLKFRQIGRSSGVSVKRVDEGDSDASVEKFWINNYKFNDSGSELRVYILGDNGGDELDVRIFDLKKINGELVVTAEPAL